MERQWKGTGEACNGRQKRAPYGEVSALQNRCARAYEVEHISLPPPPRTHAFLTSVRGEPLMPSLALKLKHAVERRKVKGGGREGACWLCVRWGASVENVAPCGGSSHHITHCHPLQ